MLSDNCSMASGLMVTGLEVVLASHSAVSGWWLAIGLRLDHTFVRLFTSVSSLPHWMLFPVALSSLSSATCWKTDKSVISNFCSWMSYHRPIKRPNSRWCFALVQRDVTFVKSFFPAVSLRRWGVWALSTCLTGKKQCHWESKDLFKAHDWLGLV